MKPFADKATERWSELVGEPPAINHARVRDAVLRRVTARQPAPRKRLLVALVAAATVALGAAVAIRARAPAFEVNGVAGQLKTPLASTPDGKLPVSFPDGSRAWLAPSGLLQVQEATDHTVRIALDRGSLLAQVEHDPNRVWLVDAGPFQVRDLGTEFVVEWQPQAGSFCVSVQHGAVQVDGPLLAGNRHVAAGQALRVVLEQGIAVGRDCSVALPEPTRVQGPAATREVPAMETPPAELTDAKPSPVAAVPSPRASAAREAAMEDTETNWRDLERAGKYAEALSAAERFGLQKLYDTASADELLDLARVARVLGRHAIATVALETSRQRFPGSPQATLAAYLLGIAAADQRRDPAQAARWFATYLREQPAGALAREAQGRLIEAHRHLGNTEEARRLARSYLERHPNGPHARVAEQVMQTAE